MKIINKKSICCFLITAAIMVNFIESIKLLDQPGTTPQTAVTNQVAPVQRTNSNGQVFDIFQTIGMVRKVAEIVLDIPSDGEKATEFTTIMGHCFKTLEDQQSHFEPVLKAFFDRCQNIFDKPENWQNKIFEETILNGLAAVAMKVGNKQTTCQLGLKLKPNPDTSKLKPIFDKMFGGFTNVSAEGKQKFITNQFSVHRSMLPEGSFDKMNKESRGQKTGGSTSNNGSTPDTKANPTVKK